ncbi:tyrosine-type recombinase/integrase [Candidatus Agathobaculum pullicola]|uniref:tyrosine-type recombinase/integrase n=1 Tax=Candidatus Agathobaculum pullicola TaxID=2838426 RepID=UPI003F8FD0F2
MLRCRLRRGETIPLRWKDMDFENKILSVNKVIAYDEDIPKAKSTRTESSIRHVPLPPDFLQLLKERKQLRHEDANNQNGRMLDQTQVRRLQTSIQRQCDIALRAETSNHGKVTSYVLDQDITPHYLRHTYCTDLRRQGAALREAQALMGMGTSERQPTSTTASILMVPLLPKSESMLFAIKRFHDFCRFGPQNQQRIIHKFIYESSCIVPPIFDPFLKHLRQSFPHLLHTIR